MYYQEQHLFSRDLAEQPSAVHREERSQGARRALGVVWGTQTHLRVSRVKRAHSRASACGSSKARELARGPWCGVWAWGAAPEPHVSGPPSLQVLRSLNKTYQNLKRKPVAVDLDPKAVTCDELFGIINPATREWKDGNRAGSPQGQGDQWPEQAS